MKQILILAIAAISFTACNDDANPTENKVDSITDKIDSTTEARKDSLENSADSLKQKVENSLEKTDSANQAIADSASRVKKG